MTSYQTGQEINGRTICGARTRSGAPCKRPPAKGRTRCRLHGGASPRGLASPHTKHGRFSRDLPARMLDMYEAALADEDLIALREDIALVTARELDLLRRVDSGESGTAWKEAGAVLRDHGRAVRAGDDAKAEAALDRLREIIDGGATDAAAWRELLTTIEQRRRLAETERRRLVDLDQLISHERALLFATALLDAVRRTVTDRDALATISADFATIVNTQRPESSDDGADV